MTSVLKPDRMGKSASKGLKKKNDREGIQRVQKVFDSLNAEHEAEINHSTSTPAELDENGISPPQDTTLRITTKRSDHDSTLLKDRGASTLGVFQEPPEETSFGAQNASLALEGLNDDMINARGFSRLSEHRTVEAIAACKRATSILIEIVNKDTNNAYVTPYTVGGLQAYGLPYPGQHTYASPYSKPVPNVNITPSPSLATNDGEKSSIEPGRKRLDRTEVNAESSIKDGKPQELPVQSCNLEYGDHPAKRRKRNSSVQYLKASSGLHKKPPTNGSICNREKIAEGSKQTSDKGIDELKGSVEEREKVYPTTIEGIDNFLTQAKGRFPGPDSDDSENDANQVNRKSAEKQSDNGDATISPPSSPQSTNGQTKPDSQDALCAGDRDIWAIVDRIATEIMLSESSPSVFPQGVPHFNFRGSLEAQRLAIELKRQVTVLDPKNNVIVSKDLGLVMSTFYNHLSSRASSCPKPIIPPPQAQFPFDIVTPMAQPGFLPINHQPLPAHVYEHVPPPATFHQTVLPSQAASFPKRGNVIPPSTIPVKEKQVERYGFPPTPDARPGRRKRPRN